MIQKSLTTRVVQIVLINKSALSPDEERQYPVEMSRSISKTKPFIHLFIQIIQDEQYLTYLHVAGCFFTEFVEVSVSYNMYLFGSSRKSAPLFRRSMVVSQSLILPFVIYLLDF